MKTIQAYTFIELCIVIMMLGILAATALPRLFNFNTNAYRTLNIETAASLNAAVSKFMAEAPLRTPRNYIANWSIYGPLSQFKIDGSNPAIYSWAPANYGYYPISVTSVNPSPGDPAAYSSRVLPIAAEVQTACADIFNAFMGLKSNITAGFSGYSSTGAVNSYLYGSTNGPVPTKPTYNVTANGTYLPLSGQSCTTVSPTMTLYWYNALHQLSCVLLPFTMQANDPVTYTGQCVYQLNASSTPTFNIYYNQGRFYAFEYQ